MNYIRRHWRGELSLAVSFWVNVFLLNVFIRTLETWLTQSPPIEHPQTAARVTLIYVIAALAIVYPWQVLGLWRACLRHIAQTGITTWGRMAQILTVIGILGTLINVKIYWPIYQEIYQIGFGKDAFGKYIVELKKHGSIVHLQGGLGFGVSKDVAGLLAKHPTIKRDRKSVV